MILPVLTTLLLQNGNIFQHLSGSRITAGDTELMDNLNVYPNPTRGLFNISFISEKIDYFEITIVDAFGKIVYMKIRRLYWRIH